MSDIEYQVGIASQMAQTFPSGYVDCEDVASTDSATFVDIAGAVFTLTLIAQRRIAVWMSVEVETAAGGGSTPQGEYAVSIGAQADMAPMHRSFGAAGDIGSLSTVARSDSLAPGTYTIQARHRRTAGTALVQVNHVHMIATAVAP